MQSRQPFEVELDLFPGQIFQRKVDAIWWASGEASDIIPAFEPPDPQGPKGQFAVKITVTRFTRLLTASPSYDALPMRSKTGSGIRCGFASVPWWLEARESTSK